MNRMPDINDWISCPDDMPSYAVVERDEDTLPALKRPQWTDEGVAAFRFVLFNMGLTAEQVNEQVVKECGEEWNRAPYLTRRQAI